MKRIVLLLPVVGLLAGAGCAKTDDLLRLQGRVEFLEKEKATMQADQKRDLERVEKLHTDMNDATEALNKRGANLVADIDDLKGQITKLHGTDEETSYAIGKVQEDLAQLKKGLEEKGISIVPLPKDLGEDANSLFTAGQAAFAKGDFPLARGIFAKFLATFPDDPRAGEAQFQTGDSYFKEGKYGQAIRELQRVHDKYKDVAGAPIEKSLLRIAEALLKENDCRKAAGVLKYLVDYNKKAPEAEQAKERLKGLKKTCKGL